jgi:hypothetical protein
MQNGVWSPCKRTFVDTRPLPCLNVSNRLISRFFLELRSVYHDGQSTVETLFSVSGISTHPFRNRASACLDFSVGLGAEMHAYTVQHEGTEPQVVAVDLELGTELRARHDGSEHDIGSIADPTSPDEK